MAEQQGLVNKYGKPLSHDRNFRGPLFRNRGCTDIPCLIIFLLFLGAWGFIAYYAVRNGDLNKLMVPTNSLNQKCGIDSQVLGKKYLFFFNLDKCIDPLVPLTGCPTPQVCVESCPTQTFIWDTMKNSLSFAEIKKRLICISDAEKNRIGNMADAEKAIMENRCARWYLKSAPFLNRCMWEFSPQICEIIPPFLLQRNRRELLYGGSYDNKTARVLRRVTDVNSNLDMRQEEPAIQCRRHTELGETVIKDKMMQTDTRLAKFVGNFIAHFYNGTHDTQQIGEAIVEDIVNSWPVVFVALACTLVASLIFIALMRWLSAPILWFSIFGVLICLIAGIYYSIHQYTFWRDTPTVPNHSLNLHSAVKNFLQEPNTWLYISIILCIVFVIISLLVIVLRKRIHIAIALTKEGSKAVSSVISTVFFPIFSWVLFIAAVCYAVAVGLYLGSIGESSFRMIRQLNDDSHSTSDPQETCVCVGPAVNYKLGDKCDPNIFQNNCYIKNEAVSGFFQQFQRNPCAQTSCSFVQIDHPTLVNWFIVYNIFGFLWLAFFIGAFSDMVLAMVFATWYWTFKKRDVPYFTLTRALRQTVCYHLGTLAFGSLILAICRLIRLLLEYIDSKLKTYDNVVTRAILCCMKCFFWALESFLRFLNRNAYIMCAIHGKSFCTSAKDAFNLVMRNFLRVITIDKVTDFLFFLSRVLLTSAAGVSTYFFLISRPSLIQLHYTTTPVVIVTISAFIITSVFFSVYSMAVDTLFLCFLEDIERNDGSPEKPYYMSKQLMKILGKRNKRLQRLDLVERK